VLLEVQVSLLQATTLHQEAQLHLVMVQALHLQRILLQGQQVLTAKVPKT
jgi:hypothetical protein